MPPPDANTQPAAVQSASVQRLPFDDVCKKRVELLASLQSDSCLEACTLHFREILVKKMQNLNILV